MGRSGGGEGGEGGKDSTQVVEVRALLELEVEVAFGEVEMGEPVLIHELDDSTDFLEFHGKEQVRS